MNAFNLTIFILATIVLFLFSLQGFSKEIQEVGLKQMKDQIEKIANYRLAGFSLGVLLTMIVQSSSAVTSITVSMVDAGVISFFNSLPLMIGANLGTTFTAWLVALKLENLGSLFLVLGMLISFLPFKMKIAGKSVFYLGLILFSLQQIGIATKPLGSSPQVMEFLSMANNTFYGILIGAVITMFVQSSSVTTGLTIILADQNMISLHLALAIVIGTNIGTTSTAILASSALSKNAKTAALANFLFNVINVFIALPLLLHFESFFDSLHSKTGHKIALAHLLFNTILAVVCLPAVRPIGNLAVWFSDIFGKEKHLFGANEKPA
jgi:phosphate:Na+ symporter